MKRCVLIAVALAVTGVTGQEQLPRFRAGANLVRVDAYVSKDGVALTDLTQDDFLVFEDDKVQPIESFDLIAARAPNPQSERTNPTNVRDMRQQAAEAGRIRQKRLAMSSV